MKITTSSLSGSILQCPQEVLEIPSLDEIEEGIADGAGDAVENVEVAEEEPRSFHSVQASQEAVLFEETQEAVEMHPEVAEEGTLEVVAEGTLEVEGVEAGASEVVAAIKGQGYSRMFAINFFFMSNSALVDSFLLI